MVIKYINNSNGEFHMTIFKYKRAFTCFLTALFISNTFLSSLLLSYAEEDYIQAAEARKSLAIQSNETTNWPQGPAIGAEAAILMEANTGTILYAKNIHEKNYPASTTKILTCLLATENSEMNEVVDYSTNAVFSIEKDSSNMGMDAGEKITMEQSLYGVLVGSANEAANAVAEHISGSVEEFSKLMNQRAKELGCEDSHFVNPNGLYNDEHYTSAYDLATIGRSFFKNELLCKMSSTATYEIPPTATQPDDIYVHSKNKLLSSRECSYEYLVGSKTGFTSEARQTLVSCAKKDGITLICVIMKEESPNQFTDTVELFDYGFNNFQKINISDNEVQYSINNNDLFNANEDVLGNSEPVLSLNKDDYIVIPKAAGFEDTTSSLTYDNTTDNSVASIDYSYNDVSVGSVTVDLVNNSTNKLELDTPLLQSTDNKKINNNEDVIFINVTKILFIIIIIASLLISVFVIHSLIGNYNFSKRRRSKASHKKRKKLPSKFDHFDF